jgi:HAD superfamily hydrolase (TIGR01549 family)
LGIEDDGDVLKDSLYRRFTRYESYRLFPDATPALQSLKKSGLTVGLISNFEEWLEGMLIHFEVAPLFDLMVISGKEGIEKPDPQIFERALERTGVRPQDAVYVGDQPVIDIEAAESIGMTGVLIDRRGRHPDFPGTRIETLNELNALLLIP